MASTGSFAQVKLEALEQKKFTDCTFLVGDDGEDLEEFNGIKADLMIVSGFMEGLFNSSLCPKDPIRIKNLKPKLFRMIMEFAHVGQVISPCSCLEVAELAVAADQYLIYSLKPVCADLIRSKVTVENVWSILDLLCKFDLTDVASGCHNLLSEKTEMCLHEDAFLASSKESVRELLKLDRFFISSEKRLFDYCYKWAQNTADERDSLMRYLLSGFRLLTLEADEGADLPQFLTAKESIELLRFFITRKLGEFPETMNLATEKRHPIKDTEQILMSTNDYELSRRSSTDSWHRIDSRHRSTFRNTILLTTTVDILITKITCVQGLRNHTMTDSEKHYISPTFTPHAFFDHITLSVRNVNKDADAEVEKTTTINYDTICLKISEPILISKDEPMKLEIIFKTGTHNILAPVPWTVFDLSAAGDETLKCFKQLQFEESVFPIVIKSISHRLK